MDFWILAVMGMIICGIIGYLTAKFERSLWGLCCIIIFVLAGTIWLLIDDAPDFTGNPRLDAVILYDRIDEGKEDEEDVYKDLEKVYTKHGYGIHNYHEAIRIYNLYKAGKKAHGEQE